MTTSIAFRGQTVARLAGSACLVALLAGCAANDPNRNAKTGAGIGAVAGAVLGGVIDDGGEGGIILGGALGALAGGLAGNYVDEQERAFEEELAEERRLNQLEIERLEDDVLKLSLNSEVSFDFGKADIKPSFYDSLDKLSGVIRKYDRTVAHVVGHTDSIGSEASNQRLSERRADAVGSYMMDRGVLAQRLRTSGEGERLPRATNATEAGRQLNRRVEIFLKPIVEGREQEAFESPTET